MNEIKENEKIQPPPPPIILSTPTISRNRSSKLNVSVDPINHQRKSGDKTTPHKDHATKISNSTNTYQLGKLNYYYCSYHYHNYYYYHY